MRNSNTTRSQQSVCRNSFRNITRRNPFDHSSKIRHHTSVDHPYVSRHQATITPHNYPLMSAHSGGIGITNVSSRDEVNRILRPDVAADNLQWHRSLQNWGNDRYVTNDPFVWIRRFLNHQKEQDAILGYFKTRIHRVAAPKDGVNNPTKTEEICPICLREFKQEETIGTLRCGHDYHTGCIKQWLLKKKDCPMCRASVLPFT